MITFDVHTFTSNLRRLGGGGFVPSLLRNIHKIYKDGLFTWQSAFHTFFLTPFVLLLQIFFLKTFMKYVESIWY